MSYGSGPHRAAMGLLRRMADEARTTGTYTALTEGAVPYRRDQWVDGETGEFDLPHNQVN